MGVVERGKLRASCAIVVYFSAILEPACFEQTESITNRLDFVFKKRDQRQWQYFPPNRSGSCLYELINWSVHCPLPITPAIMLLGRTVGSIE